MPQHFFADSVALAWTYFGVVLAITLIATYTDLRSLLIPKWLTLPALAGGVIFHVVLGGVRGPSFLWADGGWLLGAVDGLLFALAGFAVGFALFFVMFMVGACHGGDVKLFAAVGAWVGPLLVILLLAVTIVFVVLLSIARLVWQSGRRGFRRTVKDYSMTGAAKRGKGSGKQAQAQPKETRKRLMAYSPAVAMSTALVLLFMFRVPLHLVTPKPEPTDKSHQANATH
jgi:prepilin peptidase CpaA